MGRDTAEGEEDGEDRKMPANEDDAPDKSSQVGRDTAEEEEDDEDRKMPAEEEEDGEEDEAKSSLKAMVEAKRTPKPSFLLEEELDDDSPAGIAKPSSSDTAPAFKSSDDTPGQLKGPPEKNLLMSNMLKFDTDSKSAPVGNLKTEGDLDQHPVAQPAALPNVAELEEQPEAAPPAVAPVAVAAGVADAAAKTKKRKGGGPTSANLKKLAKVDKKGMKTMQSFFG